MGFLLRIDGTRPQYRLCRPPGMCAARRRDDGVRIGVAGLRKDLEAIWWRDRYWGVCRRLVPHCFDWSRDWIVLCQGPNSVGAPVQETAFLEAARETFAAVGVDQVEVGAARSWSVCCVRMWHSCVRQCDE